MSYGIIDLGSNSVKLSIYQFKNNKIKTLFTHKETVGLATYIDKEKNLSEEGIKRAIEVVFLLKDIAKQKRVSDLQIIATAVIRNASNTDSIIKEIKDATNLKITLLSGEEEAIYAFYGVKLLYEFNSAIIVDIGGGSTEIVIYEENEIKNSFSIPLGSLNTYITYVKNILPTKKEIKIIKEAVMSEIKKLDLKFTPKQTIYGVGGTLNTLKKINNYYNNEKENNEISYKDIKNILKKVDHDNKESYIEIIQLASDRIHTIFTGLVIIKTVYKYFDANNMIISKHGIREGFMSKYFSNLEKSE